MHDQEERTLPSTPPTINWMKRLDERMDRLEKVASNVDTRSAKMYEGLKRVDRQLTRVRVQFFYAPGIIALAAIILAVLSYGQSQAAQDRIEKHIQHHRDAGR